MKPLKNKRSHEILKILASERYRKWLVGKQLEMTTGEIKKGNALMADCTQLTK